MFARIEVCGYVLERGDKAVLTSTNNLCFGLEIQKIVYPCKPKSQLGLRGYTLHGHVILMFIFLFSCCFLLSWCLCSIFIFDEQFTTNHPGSYITVNNMQPSILLHSLITWRCYN